MSISRHSRVKCKNIFSFLLTVSSLIQNRLTRKQKYYQLMKVLFYTPKLGINSGKKKCFVSLEKAIFVSAGMQICISQWRMELLTYKKIIFTLIRVFYLNEWFCCTDSFNSLIQKWILILLAVSYLFHSYPYSCLTSAAPREEAKTIPCMEAIKHNWTCKWPVLWVQFNQADP